MLRNQDIKWRLISAVREGRLEIARELINSYGLSYLPRWAEGYVLLRDAVENNHVAIAKLLLTNGSKVNRNSIKPSNTPLHFAAINGDLEIVKLILDKGGNVNAKNQDGETPLHNAIEKNRTEVIELLLKHGADVNYVVEECRPSKKVYTFLKGRYTRVNLVVVGEDSIGLTPLHIAAKNGYVNIAENLLNHGACIHSSTLKEGCTPLNFATKAGHVAFVNLLLQHGAKVDDQDKDGKTILNLAVEKENLMIVKDVLKYCPDINNESNRSALKTAVYGCGKEYKNIVEALLEYGFTVNPEDANNPVLLHAAIEKGYLEIVEDLLKYGADVNTLLKSSYYELGFTPLHTAAKNKQEAVAELLIRCGADVNARDKTRKTPIFYAIKNADLNFTKLLLTNRANVKDNPELLFISVKNVSIEIVELLLQHDADVNASDKYGRTALHFTAVEELEDILRLLTIEKPDVIKGEIAKLLLSKGANVDAQTQNGVTTLITAIQKGYAKVVEALLEYNADIKSGEEMTPLHDSAWNGNGEICRMLLKKGANVNAKSIYGHNALDFAIQKDHKYIVELLLEYGAEFDFEIGCDLTPPLHWAVQKGYNDITETLLKRGADVNFRDKYDDTPLHIACKEQYVEVVETLLQYGADINITNRSNDTPLDCALAKKLTFYSRVDLDRARSLCEKTAENLKRHIVKMKTANLYVSKKNLQSVSSIAEMRNFYYKCKEEIANMKSEKIKNANISFYDILEKCANSLAIYMRNENIVEALKSDDYKTEFPMYAILIKSHFRKAMKRKELLDQGIDIFHSVFHNMPELPHECTEKIFSYLSDEDLKNFNGCL